VAAKRTKTKAQLYMLCSSMRPAPAGPGPAAGRGSPPTAFVHPRGGAYLFLVGDVDVLSNLFDRLFIPEPVDCHRNGGGQ